MVFKNLFILVILTSANIRVNLPLTGPPTFKFIEAYLVDQIGVTALQTFMNANYDGQVGEALETAGRVIYISSSVISLTVTY